MQEIELNGDYYEIGQQYGRMLSQVGFSPEPLPPDKREFVHNCEPIVREYAPELLEELRGIADAGKWESDRIKAIPLALGYESGCSVVAISGEQTTTGTPLFGRNYDFYTSFADFGELYRTIPTDRLAHIGCSDHWVGRHDGINEAGVAIGHTFVPNHGPQPGIMFGVAARWVLDTCQTVTEAIAFLEQIPHARNTNFVVIDATGALAIVEASPETVTTTIPDHGFAVATNHFISPPMQEYEPTDADLSNSKRRYATLKEWTTSSSEIDIETVQDVLADPTGGVCACRTEDDPDPIETLWSWTAALGESDAYLATGRPDESTYKPIKL